MTDPEFARPFQAVSEQAEPGKVVPGEVVPAQAEASEPEPTPTVPSQVVPAQAEPSEAEPPQGEPGEVVVPAQAAPSEPEPTPTVPSAVVRAQSRRPPAADDGPLLGDIRELRDGWQRIKAGFVDDPRGAANEAAGAVDEAAQRLIAALRDRRRQIRETWDGNSATRDTEAMRLAVLRYQALFHLLVGDETGR